MCCLPPTSFWKHTLNSVTGSGHVKYQESPCALACRLHGKSAWNSAWKIISFYLLYSQLHTCILMPSGHVLIMYILSCIINDEHIFLSFGKDLHGQSSCHLYMAFQLLQNMASGHVKIRKGLAMYFTWPVPVTLLRVQGINCLPSHVPRNEQSAFA